MDYTASDRTVVLSHNGQPPAADSLLSDAGATPKYEELEARMVFAARVRPAQNRELSGHEGDMVLNGAYLVERDRVEDLRALVAALEEREQAHGARIGLAGPFPPYSFVPEAA